MSQTEYPLIVCIMGPTASGKTSLAIDLVEQLPCELISVDSALIYRGMDIGTAKPNAAELARAPHRLIDIRDPAESYSVAEFRSDALAQIEQIISAGKTPVLVGGTMMYYKSLVDGLSALPAADTEIRRQISALAEQHGWQHVHNRLKAVDPESAARIHENDPQRTNRAYEVYLKTGKTMTELLAKKSPPLPYRFAQFAITPSDRAVLHQRIALRFEQMLAQDFETEVRDLMARGDLHLQLPSMRCVGYRQMWQHINGELTRDEMVAAGTAATRQLAKRQLTWLRSWPKVHWLDTFANDNIQQVINHIDKNLYPSST